MATKPKATDKKRAKRQPKAAPAEPSVGELMYAAFVGDLDEPASAPSPVAVAEEDVALPTSSNIFDIPETVWDGLTTVEVDRPKDEAPGMTSTPHHTWWDRLAALWRKKPTPTTEPALIFEKRRFGVEDILVADIPDAATMWRYEGNWVYLLERCDGALQSVNLEMVLEAGKQENIPPDKLYRALNWKEAEVLFKIPDTLLEKINLALTVILIGILAFVCFLVYAQITEAPPT